MFGRRSKAFQEGSGKRLLGRWFRHKWDLYHVRPQPGFEHCLNVALVGFTAFCAQIVHSGPFLRLNLKEKQILFYFLTVWLALKPSPSLPLPFPFSSVPLPPASGRPVRFPEWLSPPSRGGACQSVSSLAVSPRVTGDARSRPPPPRLPPPPPPLLLSGPQVAGGQIINLSALRYARRLPASLPAAVCQSCVGTV